MYGELKLINKVTIPNVHPLLCTDIDRISGIYFNTIKLNVTRFFLRSQHYYECQSSPPYTVSKQPKLGINSVKSILIGPFDV